MISIDTKTVNLAAGESDDIATFGDFVKVHAATGDFELSFDGENFAPMNSARAIKTKATFDKITLRNPGTSPVKITLICIQGEVIDAISGNSGPSVLTPFNSYAALGLSATSSLQAGVYVTVIPSDSLANETFQLRPWTEAAAPVTNTSEGVIVPTDYTAANKRVWFKC